MDESKVHPALRAALTEAQATGVRDVESAPTLPVIVHYATTTRALEGAGEWDVRRTYSLIPAAAGEATPAEIDLLSERNDVEMIWLDQPVYAFLDTSIPKIGVPGVWERGNRGAGIRIAILDTGIDAEHPDFAGRIAATADFSGESVVDGHGHGTHVAGIAAGSGAASNGTYVGVAPEATLLIGKVLRNNGSGMMSNVMAGVEWAVEQQAHVINLSLGSPGPCDGSDAISAICNAAVDAGVVVCVAAGNEGPAARTVGSPGCATKVITVGASDDDDRVAEFSSRGPTSDGRVKPDVLFPGVNIVAARARGTSMARPVDEFYTSASGTSMATPHAAGTCALILKANPNLTPEQVKRILQQAAVNLDLDPNTQGAGRVDAARAVQLAGEEEPAPAPTPTPPTPTPTPTPPPGPTPAPVPTPPPEPTPPDGCLSQIARMFGMRR